MPKIPWVVKCSSCEQLKTVPMKPGKGFLCVPCLMGIDFYNLIYGDMGLVDPMAEDTKVNPNGGFVGIND